MELPSPIESIVTLTDFSRPSIFAFEQALAITIKLGIRLTILHVGPQHRDEVDWNRFPRIRHKLIDWNLMTEDESPHRVIRALGIEINKVSVRNKNPIQGILSYLSEHRVDMIMAANRPATGIQRLFEPSLVRALAKNYCSAIMLVPEDHSPLINSDGELQCRRWLLPVNQHPSPTTMVNLVGNIAPKLSEPNDAEVNLLHVGNEEEWLLDLPEHRDLVWQRSTDDGELTPTILRNAASMNADIIAMATAGHEGIGDDLLGSDTEHVIEQTKLPVMVVPN